MLVAKGARAEHRLLLGRRVNVGAGPEMSGPAARMRIISVLGLAQILAYGSSYYLPAVLAAPIARETGWPLPWIVAGLCIGLLAAGAVSPRVGRAIDAKGGRQVHALSSVLFAAGLLCIAAAPGIAVYLAGWVIIGLGMGTGLYDAAFGTLGKYYGQGARAAITTLTLFGGFASTVCWPLSAFLVETAGWRGACLAYAAVHVLLALPAYLALLPDMAPMRPSDEQARVSANAPTLSRAQAPAFWLLGFVITIASFVSAVVSVHLLTILQMRGLDLAGAVALGALVGPAQVGARAIEMAAGRYYHPIWTLLAAVTLMAAGIILLSAELPLTALWLVVYGAGLGIESIARGTVPLALFGPGQYATLMGRLALPSLVAQAAGPFAAALLVEWGGAFLTLLVLAVASTVNVGIAAILVPLSRSGR